MTELLPCPFCGGEAMLLIDGKYGNYTFHHDGRPKCPAAYSWNAHFTTEAEAIAAWNSRAWTVADNDAEILGDVTQGLFRDLMEVDPETAKTWALSWPELFGRKDGDDERVHHHRRTDCRESTATW